MTKAHIIFFVSFCLLAVYAHGQTPSSQPSTQPTAIDTLKSTLDSIPNGQGSTDLDIVSDTTKLDSIRVDTIGNPLDSARFGKRPPRGQQRKAPPVFGNEVYYFHPEKPKEIFQFKDTTTNTSFFQFDPARSGERDYASLGSIGTPLLPLFYEWKDKFGSRAGVNDVFDPYIKKESDAKFYTKSKAFSDFYYSQGTEQNDHIFHGDFGRSFDNGIKLTVTHDRLVHSLNTADLPLNTNALFTYAPTKNTSLVTGLSFQKPGSKYQAFFTYAHNEINQLYTGGLQSTNSAVPVETWLSIIDNANNLAEVASIPSNIILDNANLRYRLRTLALTQFFTLAQGKKEGAKSARIFNVQHKIKYTSDLYRFSDDTFNADYYGGLATDDRGIRVIQNQTLVENYVGLSTLKTVDGKAVPSPLGDISVGLTHQFARYDGEGYETQFNNLSAEGSWSFSPFSLLNIDAFGQIGILDNIGDFRFSAAAALNLDKWGTLQGILRQQRYAPSQFEQQNYVTQIEVWNNNFDKSFNSELGFKYLLPAHKLEAGLSYFLLDNHVYFDETFLPQQRNGAINLVQLYVKKDFKWNIFHLENLIMLQSSDDEVVSLPSWWSRHSLYAQKRIFNNIMLARLGFDLRMSDSYFANNFNPALGQYHIQSTREVDFYPALDVHFGFVIEKFRIFVKLENLTSVLTDDVFYQVPLYPQKEMAFRFGISWRFLDKNSNQRGSNTNSSPGNQSSGGGRPINVPGL